MPDHLRAVAVTAALIAEWCGVDGSSNIRPEGIIWSDFLL
jgi:hypothetical protein